MLEILRIDLQLVDHGQWIAFAYILCVTVPHLPISIQTPSGRWQHDERAANTSSGTARRSPAAIGNTGVPQDRDSLPKNASYLSPKKVMQEGLTVYICAVVG